MPYYSGMGDINILDNIIFYPSIKADGAFQMALDEAMLMCTADDKKPRFRFYYWSAPTISLGYFQDYHSFLREYPELASLDIVRRLTGGGAILHDKEITYCMTIPSDDKLYQEGPIKAYIAVHQAIVNVLREFGKELILRPKTENYKRIRKEPEFCFARGCPTDIISLTDELKIVGSAQRRLTGAFMQHGSIMLDSRFSCQPTLTVKDLLAGDNLDNMEIDTEDMEQRIITELAISLDKKFVPGEFTQQEIDEVQKLKAKYVSDEWTIERESSSFISGKS